MRRILYLFVPILLSLHAAAQTTTNFTGTIHASGEEQEVQGFQRAFLGAGEVGTLGHAVLALNLNQNRLVDPDYDRGDGPLNTGLTLMFNSVDRIQMGFQAIQDASFTTATVRGAVNANNSAGAYAGATSAPGGMSMTLSRTSTSPPTYLLGLTGTATIGQRSVNLSLVDVKVTLAVTQVNLFTDFGGTCAIPGIGNGTLFARVHPDTDKWDENVHFLEVTFRCEFSASDIARGFFVLTPDPKTGAFQASPITITGGAGRFLGAAGTIQVTKLEDFPDDSTDVSIAGSITDAGPATPIITSVTTAWWLPGPRITQNDWIQIKGTNLVPASTPAGGTFWSNAPEFAQGRMPTALGGVSVTVNGKPAYVWWFCSKATTPACAEDQINVLTPLDDYLGQVMVVVKNGTASSGAFQVRKEPLTPSLLRFTARGDAVATHANGRLLGPATLYPGQSTPGTRGETISLWTIGMGLPTAALVAGSSTQAGSLPFTPSCFLGGDPATVAAALVSPGLYQLNVTIPMSARPGDNVFYCTVPNYWTQPALIAVQ